MRIKNLLICLAVLLIPINAAGQSVYGDRFVLNGGRCTLRSGSGDPATLSGCDIYVDLSTGKVHSKALRTDSLDAAGNLLINPVGDLILNAGGKDILPALPYDQNLGSLQNKFLTLHAAELWVETLVQLDTMAAIEGRILVSKSMTALTADLPPTGTTIQVKRNSLANGDRVYMESAGKVEFMSVTSAASGSGPYTYTVTRNLDGSGANQWYAGDAILDTGQPGDGFIDIYSTRGVHAGTEVGPTIVGNVRNTTTYNDWSPRWAIGNLQGLYSLGVKTYGAAFGDPNGAWIVIEPIFGLRMGFGGNASGPGSVRIDTSGNASFAGTVTSSAGLIAGWNLIPNYLYSGSTSTARVGIHASDVATDVAFYAGDFNEGSAPFRVLHNGNLVASNATITGTITATGGNVTGAIVANSITSSMIAANTITAADIAATTITADRLNISSLSAITADLGTVNAGTINGVTINSSTMNAGGVTINSSGITMPAGSSAVNQLKWNDGGNIYGVFGGLTFTGSTLHFYGGSNQVLWDGTAWYLQNGGTADIGYSSNRWGTGYFNNVNIGSLAGGGTRAVCTDNSGTLAPC